MNEVRLAINNAIRIVDDLESILDNHDLMTEEIYTKISDIQENLELIDKEVIQ